MRQATGTARLPTRATPLLSLTMRCGFCPPSTLHHFVEEDERDEVARSFEPFRIHAVPSGAAEAPACAGTFPPESSMRVSGSGQRFRVRTTACACSSDRGANAAYGVAAINREKHGDESRERIEERLHYLRSSFFCCRATCFSCLTSSAASLTAFASSFASTVFSCSFFVVLSAFWIISSSKSGNFSSASIRYGRGAS